MDRYIVLDAGPLRTATLASHKPRADECRAWIAARTADGARVIVPEIADYEVRRRHQKDQATAGIRRLDALKAAYQYRPITTAAMLRAAELWGLMRRLGMPTAHEHALDGDVILAAMTSLIGDAGDVVTIATGDKDFARIPPIAGRAIDAREWSKIN